MKKNSLKILMTVFVFIAMLSQPAFAADNETPLRLQAGQSASIETQLSQANGEKISSLQLRLEVTSQDGTAGNASVLEKIENLSFSPDDAITSKAKICEQRYHENTGVLDIYIAGTQPLFSAQDTLTIGTVTAIGKDGNGVEAYIRMVTDSFKVVRGNEVQSITEDEAAVRIAVQGETPIKPENPSTPQEPEQPDSQDPMLDKSKLNEALDIASGFLESDYTAESFTVLKNAMEKAKAFVNDSNVTQKEVDATTEELLNAIGLLEPISKISANPNAQGNNKSQNTTSAQTGDSHMVWIFAAVAFVSLAVIVLLVIKKKGYKRFLN